MLSSVSTATGRASAWPALAGGPQFVAIDSNGNLTSKVEDGHSWSYEWNAENELKRVLKDAAEVARFAYDPKGRRVEKVVGGVTTSYVYDAEDILKQVAGASTARFVHGQGADEPLATESGAGLLSYEHADALGSELKQTDGSGAVTFSRSYDAFGQLQAGTSTGGYAFTGREWDPEAGLYYYRARYYDPKLGRFISEDPIGFLGGPNFYDYVRSNPVNRVDPSGLRDGKTNWDWQNYPWGSAQAATQQAATMAPPSTQWNGPGDALRHCIWSCTMTVRNGALEAAFVAWVREKYHDWSIRNPQEEGERAMDDHNNACGRAAGGNETNPAQCAPKCLQLLQNGTLTPSYSSGATPAYAPPDVGAGGPW